MIIVEDDPATRDSIALTFEICFPQATIHQFDRMKQVIKAIEQHKPDLITVDLGLPDGDGLQLIKQVREKSDLPIIVLSARSDDSTILTAIRLGADDFLVKPFSTVVLQAHVEALLRRVDNSDEHHNDKIVLTPELTLDLGRAMVILNGADIPLSSREVMCLSILVNANGKIVTNDEFKESVWGSKSVSDSALKMIFYRLRKTLGDDETTSRLIRSHRGIG